MALNEMKPGSHDWYRSAWKKFVEYSAKNDARIYIATELPSGFQSRRMAGRPVDERDGFEASWSEERARVD